MFRTRGARLAPIPLLTLLLSLAPAGRLARADETAPLPNSSDRVLKLKRDPVTQELYAPDARGPGSGVPSMNKIIPAYSWREKARAKGHVLRAKVANAIHYGQHMLLTTALGSTLLANIMAVASETPPDQAGGLRVVGGAIGLGGGYLWARAHDGSKNKLERKLARAASEQGPLLRALQRKDMGEVRRIARLQLSAMNALDQAIRVPEDSQDEAALVAQNLWAIHSGAQTEYQDDAIAIIKGASLSGPPMEGVQPLGSHRRTRQAPPPVDYGAVLSEYGTALRDRASRVELPKLGGFQLPRFGRGRSDQPPPMAQQPMDQ